MITGISTLFTKVSEQDKQQLTAMLTKSRAIETMRFFLIDNIDTLKGLNYEPWFKGNIDLSEGIWIGNGISNQFTLKVTTNSRILRVEIPEDFGYIIKKGKATLIKMMSDE